METSPPPFDLSPGRHIRLQRLIQAGLPSLPGRTEVRHDFRRKADGDALLGRLSLRAASGPFNSTSGRSSAISSSVNSRASGSAAMPSRMRASSSLVAMRYRLPVLSVTYIVPDLSGSRFAQADDSVVVVILDADHAIEPVRDRSEALQAQLAIAFSIIFAADHPTCRRAPSRSWPAAQLHHHRALRHPGPEPPARCNRRPGFGISV